MTSPTLRPVADGNIGFPDLPDDIMLDGGKLPELSIPSPASDNSADYKTHDGNWDGLSPSSSTSTSSIGSPVPSSGSLSKSRSKSMKPRRKQSAYYDEELGLWKCRNCGGNYDVPNPGSRQRREHKKACEETQRLKALERAQQQEEQARQRQAALRQNGLEEANDLGETLEGRKLDRVLQNGHGQTSRFTNDPGVIGALNTTPDIPEREEVNFGAPKELIHNVELQHRGSDGAGGQVQQTQKADAQLQGSKITGQESRRQEGGAELKEEEDDTTEALEDRDLSSEQDRPAEDQGSREATGLSLKSELSEEVCTPASNEVHPRTKHAEAFSSLVSSEVHLKTEHSEEFNTPVSNEVHLQTEHSEEFSTPVSNKVYPTGSLDHHWVDKTSPTPKTPKLEEFEQVKYCSIAASKQSRLAGTVYDRLVDLHDDTQGGIVRRSESSGPGDDETPRIASLKNEASEPLGMTFCRLTSWDHCEAEILTGKDHTLRASSLGHGMDAAAGKRDRSPNHLVEMLGGRGHSKASSLNQGAESQQNHSKAAGPSPVMTRIQSYSPQGLVSTREESDRSPAVGAAACSSSKQSESVSPLQDAVAGQRNPVDNGEEDNFGGMMVRNLGKFWKQIVSVGAVAVIAWVGKSLADRQQWQQQQQPSRRQAPQSGRGHFAVNSFYWDEQ